LPTSNFADLISNLSLIWIAGAITLATALRLALVRLPSSAVRMVADFLESGILMVGLFFLVIRPFLIQVFFIPSPSMEPTLLGQHGAGDKVVVDKLGARLHPPRRDDVTVFIAPPAALEGSPEAASGAPVDFVKRLIGVPGDRIEAHAGRVYIDGAPYSHRDLRGRFLQAGLFGQEAIQEAAADPENYDPQADYHVRFTDTAVTINGKAVPNEKIAQAVTGMPHSTVKIVPGYTIRNGVRLDEPFTAEDPDYDLKLCGGKSLKADNGRYRLNGQSISQDDYAAFSKTAASALPKNTYFMMGDNRNDSRDSTEWGPLDGKSIVGKVKWIFWPIGRFGSLN
jgi:signal peptidase I